MALNTADRDKLAARLGIDARLIAENVFHRTNVSAQALDELITYLERLVDREIALHKKRKMK